jgi:predicted permease
VDAGFDAGSVLTMRMSLPAAQYDDRSRIAAAFATIEERVAAIPGVDAAGLVLDLPLIADYQGTTLLVEGIPDPAPDEFRGAHFSAATAGYFEAMGIPLFAGRAFDARDAIGGTPTVIVNQELVRRYFGGQDPLGRRITSFGEPRTIVGVVGDVRLEDLTQNPTPAMYLPELQAAYNAMSLVVRTRNDPAATVDAVRARLREFDPRIPVFDVKTMEQVVSYAVSQPRFSSLMLAIFSAVALLLAAVGIYGVISYAVGQRTREIGIRMAMGARPGDATTMVVLEGARLVAVGVPLGLLAAVALTRFLRSLLYGVAPNDPLTLGGVSAFLIAVALLASWLPARRASRVHPMEALRSE